MYGGFGNSVLPGSCPDSSTGFNHVHSQFTGALVQVIFHRLPSMLCAAEKAYEFCPGIMLDRPGISG